MSECELCGKAFTPTPKAMRNRNYQGRYCSRVCSNRARRRPLSERFTEIAGMADRTSAGCILWPGSRDRNGYGVITDDAGRQVRATRLAYEMGYGPIPAGSHVLHRCDTPQCFRLAHLWLGTNAENTADRDAKGRQQRGERHAKAKLTEDAVRAIRRRFASGETQTALAAEYGVAQPVVSSLVRRETWKHVP